MEEFETNVNIFAAFQHAFGAITANCWAQRNLRGGVKTLEKHRQHRGMPPECLDESLK